jgi:pimeloyl-ACP methyl ester carboxylesterase
MKESSMTVSPDPQVVRTSKCEISYREVGEGPAFVTFHGGGPGASGWGNFGSNVADFSDRYRVIVPDLPGWGGSRVIDDDGTWPEVVIDAIAEFLQEIGVSSAHLLGNSAGGGVALQIAIRYPDLVDKLVLMAPWLGDVCTPVYSSQPLEGTKHLMHYYDIEPDKDRMRALVETFVFDANDPTLEAVIDARFAASTAPGARDGYMHAMHTWWDIPNAREDVRSIDKETLLVWGKNDRFCSMDDAFQYLNLIARSRLVVFGECGHWAQAEKPDEFARFVGAFLAD